MQSKSQTSAQASERRAMPRQVLESIAYVDLGDSNGGIMVNVSEGGLALRAAIPVMDEHIAKLSFQLSGTERLITSEARVAWTADDNRMVGVAFVDLDADARERLKNWIDLAANPSESSVASVRSFARGESAPLDLNRADSSKVRSIGSSSPVWDLEPDSELRVSAASPRLVSTPAPVGPLAPTPAPATGARRASPSLEAIAIDSLLPDANRAKPSSFIGSLISAEPQSAGSWETGKPASRAIGNVSAGLKAPLVILLAVAVAVLVWMLGRSGSLLSAFSDNALSTVGQASPTPNRTSRLSEIQVVEASGRRRTIAWDSQPTETEHSFATLAQRHRVPSPSVAAAESNADRALSIDAAQTYGEASPSVSQMWTLPRPAQPAPAQNASSPQQVLPPSLKQNSSSIPGVLPSALSGAELRPPTAPDVITPSGAETIEPSMRTSSGPHAGVLLRRIEPIYPPTAAAGRVEGIVAMQVVIGKDGKVHNVKVLSGPKLLVEAAVDAVKLWRYEPAVVDGKLVESRQYVQLTFKLHSH